MWSDKESEIDYLNFGEVSELVVDILTSPDMLPVSLGIFGNWGAGKSSLLKLVERNLTSTEDRENLEHEKYIIVNFDAWLYQGYDDARLALLETIATRLCEATKGNKTLLDKAKTLSSRVDWWRMMGLGAEAIALAHGTPTGGILNRGISSVGKFINPDTDNEETKHKNYEELSKEGKDLKDTASAILKPDRKNTPPQQISAFRKEYSEILQEFKKPLIVIIDNLDRCLPANAIHTLEAMRLFLFLPNTAFIIAADEDMIRGAVADYFKGTSDRHQIDYIDKLIQIPIRVPKAGIREIRSYLFMLFAIQNGISKSSLDSLRDLLEESLRNSWKEELISIDKLLSIDNLKDNRELVTAFELADRIARILANSPKIQGNPRIVKRLLNTIKMRSKTAQRRGMPLDENIITKLAIFERCAGAEATLDFYRMIDHEAGKPKILKELEELDGSKDTSSNYPKSWQDNAEFIKQWSKLKPALQGIDLRGAVYLSRETMQMGVYQIGLSPAAREVLIVLLSTENISSPEARKAISTLSIEEQIPVMEGIIERFREISDWNKKPSGFAGACLLAQSSSTASKILSKYILSFQKQSPWLQMMLKKETWYQNN
jgi:predicted KAP-like P-loop ATPase